MSTIASVDDRCERKSVKRPATSLLDYDRPSKRANSDYRANFIQRDYTENYDVVRESEDNLDPCWVNYKIAEWRNRFEHVRSLWRSIGILDPHVNLTRRLYPLQQLQFDNVPTFTPFFEIRRLFPMYTIYYENIQEVQKKIVYLTAMNILELSGGNVTARNIRAINRNYALIEKYRKSITALQALQRHSTLFYSYYHDYDLGVDFRNITEEQYYEILNTQNIVDMYESFYGLSE